MENLGGLAEFLVSAKRNSYASGSTGKQEKDHSTLFEFEEGDWRYKDQYYGTDHFIGHETVWKKKRPVWGMNYHGIKLDTLFDDKRLFTFLREALQRVEASRPFRGPASYSARDLTYADYNTGDPASFRGVEFIYQTGRAIYQLDYHGGTITESTG